MYSRNFGTFENVNPVKLTPKANTISYQKENRIPVKTFSDNSAFERFNSLGADRNNKQETIPHRKEQDIQADNTEFEVNKETSYIEENAAEEQIAAEDTSTDASVKNNEPVSEVNKHIPLPFDMKNIINIFDSDFLLIALAMAMLLFGDNETNDKLTPIALLAIMFL